MDLGKVAVVEGIGVLLHEDHERMQDDEYLAVESAAIQYQFVQDIGNHYRLNPCPVSI